MNVDNLRAYLDGLIEEVRASVAPVDQAVNEIAAAIWRKGASDREMIAIGETLRALRQPVPLQPMPSGHPLPQQAPSPAQLAEAEEQRRWQAFREQAGMGNGRADQ